MVYDRNNQIARWQGRRHADMNFFVLENTGSVHRNINHRVILDGLYNGFHEHGREGEFLVKTLFEFSLVFFAPVMQIGDIRLHKGGYMGRNPFGGQHVFGNQFAHAVHFDNFDRTTVLLSVNHTAN